MSRERLRHAIHELVDRLYETLRDELRQELLAEVRAEIHTAAPPPEPDLAPPRPPRGDSLETLVTRIGEWVDAHPHSAAGAIHEAVGGTRTSFYAALGRAREEGRVVRTGTAPRVSYASPGAPAPEDLPSDAALPAFSPGTALDRVVTFVRARPSGCAPREMENLGISTSSVSQSLRHALAQGLVRKLGHGRAVMYFPPRGAVPGHAIAEAPPPREERSVAPATASSLVEIVTAYVNEHPGCRYSDLAAATGATERRLRTALAEARASGALVLHGEKIKARYLPGPATRVTPAAPPSIAPPSPVASAPVATAAPPPATSSPAAPPPAAALRPTPLDAPTADRALAVLRELDEELSGDSHVIRLAASLQAIVAEVRVLQLRVPADHPLARRLDGAIRRITAIRAERELPFLVGLKRNATADWERLARDARHRVAKFDLDAEAVAPRRSSQRPPRPTAPKQKPAEVELEPLPQLTALSAEQPIVLVGGIKKNEVIEHVRRHHALEVEWAAMQGANARAAEALVDRIRHGNIGAVVMLEALTGTTQVKAVVAACKEAGVPFAYGGAAGTQTLRTALREIEAGLGG